MCGHSVFVMPWCPCALNFSKRPHDLTIISLVHRIISLMHGAANSCGLAGRRAGTTTGLRCSQTLWPRCLMLFFFNSHLAFVQAAAAASIAGYHTHPKSGIHEAAGSGNLDVVQGYLIDSNFDSSLINATGCEYDCTRCSLFMILIFCSIKDKDSATCICHVWKR